MSKENVELVRRSNDALTAGGVEAMLPYFCPDVVVYPFPEWVEESEYRGHDGMRRLAAVWTENFDDFEIEIHEIRDLGDMVLLLGETTGRIKASGVPIRQPLGTVYSEFRDGQIGETRNFLTWQQALEAAGLSEQAMSQENVDALRPVYEEWGRGNFRPSSDVYGPDLEWGWSEEFPDIHGVFRDPEPRSNRMLEWLSQWEDWHVEAEEYISAGKFVVVLCRYTGRGKESGAAVDTTGAHLWTMRAGKPVRLEVFSNRTKALEAAGLAE